MIEISTTTFAILITICIAITIGLNYLLSRKSRNQLTALFTVLFILLLVWIIGLILQVTFSNMFNINPLYFDYFVYIGICFLPVVFLLLSISFSKSKVRYSKKHFLLFIIPILSLILLWTNNWHHLFYRVYSVNIQENIVGKYFYIHYIYTYLLYGIGLFNFIRYSIKNSGFFSRQAILILLGSLVPIVTNLLGFIGIITMSIYITPITFALAIFCYALAIFKFDFLKVAPIALQRIVDRMSDAYLVINEENKITDFNHTLLDIFNVTNNDVRNRNLIELFKKNKNFNISIKELTKALKKTREKNCTVTMDEHFDTIDKYFHIEINSIVKKGSFLGTLILLKDVTQHTIDMQTIRENQDMLVEKERLASLGQMIGGIAHNLKTPIMSISGASEGILDLVKEYDAAIDDPEVTHEDHHEIAKDMFQWLAKINTHLTYMSDIITAVKGQAVAFSDNTINEFTIDELVKYIDILMRHELKNALINLKTDVKVSSKTKVNGNINSLVQVVNNIISNAIQAYSGEPNKDILLDIYKEKNILVIKIEDFAGGLPDKVQDKLFKEMITTKGKDGTGLGLFMSYSNIKAHFSGNMRCETTKGKGTTFYIELPV